MEIDIKEFTTLADFKKFINHKTVFQHTSSIATSTTHVVVDKLTIPVVKVRNGGLPTDIAIVPLDLLDALQS